MSKAVEFLLAVLVLQHVAALGLAQDVYRCQISADQGGLVYTPNIPDAHFTEESAAQASASVISPTLVKASNRVTYFFTLPPLSPERNCNGTVMAIQFCYHAELNNNEFGVLRDIFEFLVTDRRDQLITINSRFHVEAASSATNCVVGSKSGMNTPHDCCTLFHPPNELLIPTSSFTFGIRILSDMDFTPFIFDHRVQEFRAEQFQTAATGDSFTLGNSLTDRSLFLLRFLLEPPAMTTPSTAAPSTAAPSTAALSTAMLTIPTQQTTASTSSPIARATTQAVTTSAEDVGYGNTSKTTTTPTKSTPTTGDGTGVNNSLSSGGSWTIGVAVGGTVGGVIVGLLIGVAVGRYRKHQSKDKQKDDTAAMENSAKSYVPRTNVQVERNLAYGTCKEIEPSKDLLTSTYQLVELTKNQAYTVTPIIPVGLPNQCCITTTPSVDPDQLYATVEGERQLYATVEGEHLEQNMKLTVTS